MKRSLVILLLLSGCANTNNITFLENRIVCTVAKDKAFVVGDDGKIGISLNISDKDATVICK